MGIRRFTLIVGISVTIVGILIQWNVLPYTIDNFSTMQVGTGLIVCGLVCSVTTIIYSIGILRCSGE